MPKPNLQSTPSFYHRYVQLIEEDNAVDGLKSNTAKLQAVLQSIPDNKWDFRYADGKWNIKEMVQHMTDAERIFCYRALCIARGETQSLPGFDENAYADASNASARGQEELKEELAVVRKATELLFHSFSEEQINRSGIANHNPITVNAIGFIIAGHAMHHLNILKERYLNA